MKRAAILFLVLVPFFSGCETTGSSTPAVRTKYVLEVVQPGPPPTDRDALSLERAYELARKAKFSRYIDQDYGAAEAYEQQLKELVLEIRANGYKVNLSYATYQNGSFIERESPLFPDNPTP